MSSSEKEVQVKKRDTWKKQRVNRDKTGHLTAEMEKQKSQSRPSLSLSCKKKAQDQMKNIINFNVIKYH